MIYFLCKIPLQLGGVYICFQLYEFQDNHPELLRPDDQAGLGWGLLFFGFVAAGVVTFALSKHPLHRLMLVAAAVLATLTFQKLWQVRADQNWQLLLCLAVLGLVMVMIFPFEYPFLRDRYHWKQLAKDPNWFPFKGNGNSTSEEDAQAPPGLEVSDSDSNGDQDPRLQDEIAHERGVNA
jgi:hypothetical protein